MVEGTKCIIPLCNDMRPVPEQPHTLIGCQSSLARIFYFSLFILYHYYFLSPLVDLEENRGGTPFTVCSLLRNTMHNKITVQRPMSFVSLQRDIQLTSEV